MSKTITFILVFILCSSLFGNVFTADFEKLLTAEDVEKVTAIQGVKLIPRNATMGASGDLNFALKDDTLLLTVTIQDSSMYKKWKNEEGFFHADVPGIGDEAFAGPSFGEDHYILIFREGKKAVSVLSFFNPKAGGKPFLSQEQLRGLAKIMISRL